MEEKELYLNESIEKDPVFENRLKRAKELKEKGNFLFKGGNFLNALEEYRKGLWHVHFDEMSYNFELMENHRNLLDEIRTPLLLNCAACVIKLTKNEFKDLELGVQFTKEALKMNSKNVKALFRHSQTLIHVKKDYSEALKHLKFALEVDNKNLEVRKLYNEVVRMVKENKKKEADLWMKALGATKPSDDRQSCCSKVLNFIKGLIYTKEKVN
eukprot:snap_masked-scaffold_4-processed-gene-19.44-mRNA-1 protein AED:0.31 eAED:0.31 QI:0/-1/0/1/-1/1/1/0/212